MKKIAILNGGTSTERKVSLRSGVNMGEWCRIAGYEVDIYDLPMTLDTFLVNYREYDLVIPVFHGMYGEDGQITAFLQTLGCRYAYSDFSTHALCLDKNLTNIYIKDISINIPISTYIQKGQTLGERDWYFPLIIKPNHGGSSIATNKVYTEEELGKAISLIQDDDILIQECIEGREFTVGVYHDYSGYHALPVIEIQTISQDFFDYTEKYETDGSNEVFLEGEEELQKILKEESIRIAQYIGIKGVVRLDWRYDGEKIYFLEVNTIPGFTSGSLVPKMWKKAGKSEKEFVEMLIF